MTDATPTLHPRQGLATAKQVQEFLQVSRTTLWRMSVAGALPAVHLGRAVRFRWRDVTRVVEGVAAADDDAAA
nr:helix-turn-helix domain-containing protein [Thiomonas sp.]